MKFNKLPNFPKLSHLPRPTLTPVIKVVFFLGKHKISLIFLTCLVIFLTAAMWYRGYLISKMNLNTQSSADNGFWSSSTHKPLPTIIPDTPIPTQTNNYSGSDYYKGDYAPPTPFPTFAPLPTIAPIQVITATTTNTSSNNSSNPHCTTGSGTPNFWYSDVYPNPPATTNTGSITLLVYIRDCNQNTAPVSDSLTITLTSTDPTAKINGSSSPVTIKTQNGQASFIVSSQNSITDTFTIQDTTSNFTVTNINNQNPSVTFTNSSSSGNSNCTTGPGTPNFWYSEVSPASPISANTGSTITLTVNIKDCVKNNVSSDSLTLSQGTNDSSLRVNGSSAPVTVQAQNGVVTFSITSQNSGTDNFTIQDTTSNFTVTDANNHNPSIVFSSSQTTSTPTPTPTIGITDTPTPIASSTGN